MNKNFLAKKSWHTQTIKNVERVWKAEQEALAEKRRVEELQKQLQREREEKEMHEIRFGKPKTDKLNWMYQGVRQETTAEEYLTGQREVKPSEDEKEDFVTPALLREQAVTEQQSANDEWMKVREDPLLLIAQQEQRQMTMLRENPLVMKRLRKKLEDMEKGKKRKGKHKGKREKSKKHRKSKDGKRKRHDSDEGSDDDSLTQRTGRKRTRGSDDDYNTGRTHRSRSREGRRDYSSRDRSTRRRDGSPQRSRWDSRSEVSRDSHRRRDRDRERSQDGHRRDGRDSHRERDATRSRRSRSRERDVHENNNGRSEHRKEEDKGERAKKSNGRELAAEEREGNEEIKTRGYGLAHPKGYVPTHLDRNQEIEEGRKKSGDVEGEEEETEKERIARLARERVERRRASRLRAEAREKKGGDVDKDIERMQRDAELAQEQRLRNAKRQAAIDEKEIRAKMGREGLGSSDVAPTFLNDMQKTAFLESGEELEDRLRRTKHFQQRTGLD